MIPLKPDHDHPVELALLDDHGKKIENRSLYATRVETEDGHALETAWRPDEGERRALSNGAPLLLYVFGHGHPPVALHVGEPGPDADGLLNLSHVGRALGHLYAAIADRGDLPDTAEFMAMWRRALTATLEAPGDGGSIDDVADALKDPAGEPDDPKGGGR